MEGITPEIIKKSFKASSWNLSSKVCVLNLATDGSESDTALAAPEFLLVDLDHDDDEQDKIDVLTEYYFAFWFGWNLKEKHIERLQIFVLHICTDENSISAPAKELPLPNKCPEVRVENLNKHPSQLFDHLR